MIYQIDKRTPWFKLLGQTWNKPNLSWLVASVFVVVTVLAFLYARPVPERFVQVNAFGEWRGFEVLGGHTRWITSCGNDRISKWGDDEITGLSLSGFTRTSNLVYEHPSMGAFAKVDSFDSPNINMAAADMRYILRLWTTEANLSERFVACD